MVSDYIYDLYPRALDCGIKIHDFWELSVLEIEDYISSYNRMKKEYVKEQVSWQHSVVGLISEVLSVLISGRKDELTMPWDRYPDLFEAEKREYEHVTEQKKLYSIGDSRRAYAAEFNRRRRH